jgi:hypothetical protein
VLRTLTQLNCIRKDILLYVQVRNKWLRILETIGGRPGSMTGAPYRSGPTTDGSANGSQSGFYNNASANGRGRGRSRGTQRGRGGGGGRGGSRVVPRQATPPALVGQFPVLCMVPFIYIHDLDVLATKANFYEQSPMQRNVLPVFKPTGIYFLSRYKSEHCP